MKYIPSKSQLIIDSLLSFSLIFLILYIIGIEKIIAAIEKINLIYFTFSLIFLFLVYLCMSFRIKFILEKLNQKISFLECLKAHYIGMFFSDFTPARTGYFASLFALDKYKIKHHYGIIAIMGPAIYDFMIKLIVGSIGLVFFTSYILKKQDIFVYLGSIIMFAMITVMILLLFSKKFLNLLRIFFFLPLVKKIYSMFETAQKNSNILIKNIGFLSGIVIITWIFKSISWYFVAKSLGISLSLPFNEIFFYLLLQPLLTMLEFIPTPTLAGFGISEGASIILFSMLGVNKTLGFLFLFVARIKTILFNLVIIPEIIKLIKNLKSN